MNKKAQELLTAARDVAKAAELAGRWLTTEEKAQIDDLTTRARGEFEQEKAARQARQSIEDLGREIESGEAEELNAKALQGTRQGMGAARKSVGHTFTDSAQFKALQDRFPGGNVPREARVTMDSVQVDGMKALITSGAGTGSADSSANVLVQPDRLGLVPFPQVQPKLRDVITNGTTGSDRIEYAQLLPDGHDGVVNAAKGVKEAPATTGSVGVKPESAFGFRKASADVITIAHWIPVTKRALSDAAQIATMIDGFLARGLEQEIERMVVAGNATTPKKGEEEWNGIFNTTGVQDQKFDTDLFKTARRALTRVTNLGGQVSAFLVSPELDEQIDLARDQNGRFYGQGPFSLGPGTLWGRPRIVIPALAGTGKFIVGDLSQCVLWDREQATITATDSHADFFVRNLVALLAECRAGFGILNPGLLVTGHEGAEVSA